MTGHHLTDLLRGARVFRYNSAKGAGAAGAVAQALRMPMKSSDTSTTMHDLAAEPPSLGANRLAVTFPRTAALVLLLVGVSLEQPAVEIGVATVKPEHMAIALLWLLAGWRLLSPDLLRRGRYLPWIVAYRAVIL